jgi:hypothetical protein
VSYIEEAKAVVRDIGNDDLAIYDDQPAVLWGILNALIGIHEQLNNGLVAEVFE